MLNAQDHQSRRTVVNVPGTGQLLMHNIWFWAVTLDNAILRAARTSPNVSIPAHDFGAQTRLAWITFSFVAQLLHPAEEHCCFSVRNEDFSEILFLLLRFRVMHQKHLGSISNS